MGRLAVKRWLAIVVASGVLAAAGFARWTPPRRAGDLYPRPDALEYEASARSLRDGTGYSIPIAGRRYAPRYPPGFPALLVPFLAVRDSGPGSGIVAVLATALLGIALAMLAAWAASG
ncbi:MAG: hypothetical protein AB1689_05425, partial [Thermodesulfobacteriota bacterium]